jgi:hypothetical protein
VSVLIEAADGRDAYLRLRDEVENGREVSPRGQRTLEIPAATIRIEDPTQPAPTGLGRGLNSKIGAAEAAHLIGGVSDANQLINCAKNFAMFVEGPAGDRLMGAYGPRVASQWHRVIDQLTGDRDSRQAGVNIWRYDELAEPSKDVPCTLSLFYQIRDDKLEAFTTMRSNDLVWGVPYDWMMFTAVQRALAFALGVGLGPYTHHAYSMHAYVDRDDISVYGYGHEHEFEQPPAYYMADEQRIRVAASLRSVTSTPKQRWDWVAADLRGVVYDIGGGDTGPLLPAHDWYASTLEGTQSGGKLCPRCRYVLPRTPDHWPDVYWESGVIGWCEPCATGY